MQVANWDACPERATRLTGYRKIWHNQNTKKIIKFADFIGPLALSGDFGEIIGLMQVYRLYNYVFKVSRLSVHK